MTTATDIAEAQLKMPIRRDPGVERRLFHRTLKPLIGTPVNAAITLICLWVMWLGVKGAYGWLVTRAVTEGGAQACKVGQGACWPYYAAKLRFMVFGVYPYDEHWRVALAMILFLGAIAITMIPRFWNGKLLALWAFTIVATGVLISGGVFGLSYVPTTQWSGLPLSFLLSAVGLALGFPLGVVLAVRPAAGGHVYLHQSLHHL